MKKKIFYSAMVFFAIVSSSFFPVIAAVDPEFSENRLVTYVRLVIQENYAGSGSSGYRGMALMVETRDQISERPAFVANVMFSPRKTKSPWYVENHLDSVVKVRYLEGAAYFAEDRVFPVNLARPHLTTDIAADTRDSMEADFKVHRSRPITRVNGVDMDLYNDWLENTFFQFSLPNPVSFNGLIEFLRGMRVGAMEFSPYTLTGYSWYYDSINCIGFCLRVLDRLGLRLPADSFLAVYLNHDYALGFTGWAQTRFSTKKIMVLKLERALERLFQRNDAGDVIGSIIPDMQVIDIQSPAIGAPGAAPGPIVVDKRPWKTVHGTDVLPAVSAALDAAKGAHAAALAAADMVRGQIGWFAGAAARDAADVVRNNAVAAADAVKAAADAAARQLDPHPPVGGIQGHILSLDGGDDWKKIAKCFGQFGALPGRIAGVRKIHTSLFVQ